MQKAEKQSFVQEMSAALKGAGAVFVTQQTGLTVAQATELRRQVRAAGAQIRVAKNTLAQIAVEGTPYAGLKENFKGPTAFSYASEPVALAKVLVQFAQANDKFSVVAGAIGEKVLNKAEVVQLSKLPSLDEIRATFVALLVTPATRIARIAVEPAAQLARVFGAYSRSQS